MSPIATPVQIQMIQRIKKESPKAQDLFELHASRLRARRNFGFKRTIRVLREHGTPMTKEELFDICKRLEKVGIGKLHQNAAKTDYHFELFYDLISVAQVATGEAKSLDPAPRPRLDLPELRTLSEEVEAPSAPVSLPTQVSASKPRSITVRYGAFEMEVPLSMDSTEREQAAELIASLPQVKPKT